MTKVRTTVFFLAAALVVAGVLAAPSQSFARRAPIQHVGSVTAPTSTLDRQME